MREKVLKAPKAVVSTGRSRKRFCPSIKNLLAPGVLCVVALLAYSNSFGAGFALDNKPLLLQDPRIKEASSVNIDLIFQHTYWWPHGESYLYRPFATLSYLFNYAVLNNGDRPPAYHWINLLLHATNVLLAYGLARRLIRGFWPAFFVAAIWAVHPILTESVTNIVGRPDLLAAGSILSGVLINLKASEASGWRRFAWLAGLLAASAIGIFSKESAAVIILVLALYPVVWWKDCTHRKQLLLGSLVALLPLAAMLYLRAVVLAGSPPMRFPFTDNPLTGADFWTARLTALKIIGLDLWEMIWPAHLSCDYSYAQIPFSSGNALDWLAWFSVAAAAAGMLFVYRRSRPAFYLALVGVITFLPSSNLFYLIGTIRAERFLYLPALGLAACVVTVVYKAASASWIRYPHVAPLLLCTVVAALLVRTWVRNSDWNDDLTLATATVQASPMSYKAHAMMAASLYETDSSHSNIDSVINQAEASVKPLNELPDSRSVPLAYLKLGEYYLAKGDLSKRQTEQEYTRSIQALQKSVALFEFSERRYRREHVQLTDAISPQYVNALGLLSTARLRIKDNAGALAAVIEAQRLEPDNTEVYRQLATVLLAENHPEQAAEKLMEGAIATADSELRQDLFKLYQNGGDPNGCAIRTEASGSEIDPSCKTVHHDICIASAEIVKLRLQTGRKDLADETRNTAINEFGCPAEQIRIP